MVTKVIPEENLDETLLDESEYSRKSEFSKAVLTQNQVAKCLDLRSKDMRPGYTTFVMGSPQVIPDSRKEFVGAVECLKNLLAPEIDIKMPDLEEKWDTGKKTIFERYAYWERIGRKIKGEKIEWVYSGTKFVPQKGATLMCQHDQYPRSERTSWKEGLWDAQIDAYWDELVNIADELFAELNRLIHELDYFKTGTSH